MVDFNADDGTRVLSLRIERIENGYRLVIDPYTDDYLQVVGANEPPHLRGPSAQLDLDYRFQQMGRLATGLQGIADAFQEHVFYNGEGDPTAFGPGHFVFHPLETDEPMWFAIEELYELGTDWDDEHRPAIGWAWHETGPVRQPDGRIRAQRVAEGSVIPSDVDHLLDRARAWAERISADATEAEATPLARRMNLGPDHGLSGR